MGPTDMDAAAGAFAIERHARILQRLEDDGRVEATALAAEFGLSTETIRRDLIFLEEAGSLRRVHGGAVLGTGGRGAPDIGKRGTLMTAEKAAIAELAATFVPAAAVVLIDGGTTAAALAEAYPTDRATTVITQSLIVASALLRRSTDSVHLLGGDVSPRTWSVGGPWAVEALENVNAEILFLGCSGFSAARGATTSDQIDAEVKRALLARARRVVALADSSKIGKDHLTAFAEPSQIDLLITGRNADESEVARIAKSGVEVRRV